MRINFPEGVFDIDEEGNVTLLRGDSPELVDLVERASGAACGPPLWAGAVEVLRSWGSSHGYELTEVDVPELPSVEDRVY